MKIVIFGGRGFIGRHLTTYFTRQGHHVIIVSRTFEKMNNPLLKCFTWKDVNDSVQLVEDADAFINLVGETINQYWTKKAKEKIVTSRVEATKKIVTIIKKLNKKPNVVINSSAVGIYGMSETETFDESSDSEAHDFLATVVMKWEEAADELQEHTRLIKLRLGVVLGNDGGALPKMILPYKFYVGGKIGSGRQWFSWIHIEDLIRLIEFCIKNERISGPVNATSPNPVTNDAFGKALAAELNHPHFFPIPSFLLTIMLGEMSQMLLKGQKVLPHIALQHGFQFKYETIEEALQQLIKKHR